MANPTGALYLYLDVTDSAHQLGYVNLDGSNNSQNFTANTGTVAFGAHSLIAKYNGDSSYHPAQGNAPITVDDPLGTVTVAVVPVPNEVKQGQPIAVTVTLTPQ